MKEIGLRERLVRYFQRNHTKWLASGELQRLVVQHTKHTPRSAVRRLQEMHEEGVLDRELRKGHTFYRYANPKQAGTTSPTNATPAHNPHTCQGCKENTLAVANW